MKIKQSDAQIRAIESKIKKIAIDQGRSPMEARTLFLLERAAARMVLDPELYEHLIFKGGYVALRVYQSPRFTSDIDALIQGLPIDEAIRRIRAALDEDIRDGAWFSWMGQETLKTQGAYGGIRLDFRAGVGDPPSVMKKAQRINIDLGIGDPVTPGPRRVETGFEIGEGALSWQVYPIETILAEKLHALITLGSRNSRSKDVYDIDLFWRGVDIHSLRNALEKTFAHRNDPLPTSIAEKLKEIDSRVLKRGWDSAIASIKNAPTFESTFNSLLKKSELL